MNQYSPELLALMEARKPQTAPTIPTDPDEAAALVLALLADPTGQIVPAQAYDLLADRNRAMRTASKAEIKDILTRQVTILEAVTLKYLSLTAREAQPKRAEPLSRVAMTAQKALLKTLGAIHAIDSADESGTTIEAA